MGTPTLTRNFDAGAAVAGYRIVKPGAADGAVIQAAAATDALMGVAEMIGGDSGGRVDVHMEGIADVEYGGNVTRGDLLTSDADGKAVTAAPAGGSNNRVIGVALVSGVAGDIGQVIISPGSVQG